MIDAALLRKLGWSEELIAAADNVAGSLRTNPAAGIPLPTGSIRSAATSAVYSETVAQNAATAIEINNKKSP